MRYYDSSALVKLVLEERETPALGRYTDFGQHTVSSDLARTEVIRAVRRSDPSHENDAIGLLRRISLIPLTPTILDAAGRLAPPALRSLDVIHLASALTIREDLEAFVAYDARLLDAAAALGLSVASPSDDRIV